MMGMGRDITSTPEMAQNVPISFPNPEILLAWIIFYKSLLGATVCGVNVARKMRHTSFTASKKALFYFKN